MLIILLKYCRLFQVKLIWREYSRCRAALLSTQNGRVLLYACVVPRLVNKLYSQYVRAPRRFRETVSPLAWPSYNRSQKKMFADFGSIDTLANFFLHFFLLITKNFLQTL